VKVLIVILFWSLSLSTMAQQTITGRVVDKESGEGLIGAHLYQQSNWRNGTIAGLDGQFALQITTENDSLIVSYVGFKEQLLPITLSDMLIKLEPIQVETEEVVIMAKPLIAEEFKYMQIKKMDIYTNPSAKADPILAINSLPSATTTDESANISLRGSSPIETGVFLNNVPVYDAVRYSQLNGIGTFSIFNTAIISDVTVFPGNPPLEFGNTTAGVISLKTDERVLKDNTNSAVVSLANIGFSREQKLNKNNSLKLFSNWQPSSAIIALNETALSEIEAFESVDLGIYWYGSNETTNWKFLNYSILEGYQFKFKSPSFSGIFDQKKKRSFLVSSIEKDLKKGTLSFGNSLSVSDGDYSYSNVAFNVKKNDLYSGLNYLISGSKFSLKSGVSLDQRMSEASGNYHEVYYALAQNHPTETFNETTTVKTLEGYMYFKYFISEQFVLGSGLRKNIPLDDQKNYLGRQVNLAFNENFWTVSFGTGKYFKNGLRENSGEPFSTESNQVSFDIKYDHTSHQIALSLFDKSNQIDSGSYTAKGAELFINYRFSSKITASTSLTWLNAKSSNMNDYQYDLNYFIRGNLAYSPGRMWTIEGTAVTREGLPYTNVESANYDTELNVYEPSYSEMQQRFDAYSNISLSLSKMFSVSEKLNVIAFASLSNVIDRKNVRSFTYNFDYSSSSPSFYSRRTGYAGLVINF
jgi:hypothetical protein